MSQSSPWRALSCALAVMAGLLCAQGACSLRSLDYLKNGHKQDGAMMDRAERDVADLGTPSPDTVLVELVSLDSLAADGTGGTGGAGGYGEVGMGAGGSGVGGTEIDATGIESSGGGTAGTGGTWATGGDPSSGGSMGSGGGAATGGTSATGGNPTTGGSTGTGGLMATGGISATGGSSSVACSGVLRSGICWYLAAVGGSCTQACADHGGPSSLAAGHVGTAAQGGSLSECATILSLLGVAGTVQNVVSTSGVGCLRNTGMTGPGPGLYWCTSPAFSATASLTDVQPACGCLR